MKLKGASPRMNKRLICKGYSNAVISISHLAINSKVYVIDGKAEP